MTYKNTLPNTDDLITYTASFHLLALTNKYNIINLIMRIR